jgi:hypothetical protein
MRSFIALLGMLALAPTNMVIAASKVAAHDSHAWKDNLHQLRATSSKSLRGTKSTSSVSAFSGSPYTIENLIARVEANPGQFARFHGLHYTQILLRDIRLRAMSSQDCTTLNGLLANTAYHRYLKFRRSLDPSRFDHFHPILGPLLAEDMRLRSLMNCPNPPPNFPPNPPLNPPPPPPGGTTDNGNGNDNRPQTVGVLLSLPTAVPEPSGVLLLLIGAGSMIVARKFRRGAKVSA